VAELFRTSAEKVRALFEVQKLLSQQLNKNASQK
jgi:hypothetical protein